MGDGNIGWCRIHYIDSDDYLPDNHSKQGQEPEPSHCRMDLDCDAVARKLPFLYERSLAFSEYRWKGFDRSWLCINHSSDG